MPVTKSVFEGVFVCVRERERERERERKLRELAERDLREGDREPRRKMERQCVREIVSKRESR